MLALSLSSYTCILAISRPPYKTMALLSRNRKVSYDWAFFLSLPHGMFKDFIDLSMLKDAQPGFSSQSELLPGSNWFRISLLTWESFYNIWRASPEKRPWGLCRCHNQRRMCTRCPAQQSFGNTQTFIKYDLWSKKNKSAQPTFRKYDLWSQKTMRAHPSLIMTTTKTLRSVFSWHASIDIVCLVIIVQITYKSSYTSAFTVWVHFRKEVT